MFIDYIYNLGLYNMIVMYIKVFFIYFKKYI